jgi:hypothetical protein
VWRLKVSDQSSVDDFAAFGIDYLLQRDAPGLWRELIFAQELAQQFERARTAEADDADTTAAGRGGKSDDGIRNWHCKILQTAKRALKSKH